MRACLSFLVVEYMHMGIPVGEACKRSIERLQSLIPLHQIKGKQTTAATCSQGITPILQNTQHSSLVVGVVAVDVNGNVRQKTLLCTVQVSV